MFRNLVGAYTMSMNQAEADSFKSICKTIVKGMGDVAKQLRKRIDRLEAENKELRQLWIDHEKAEIENKVRIDRIYQAAGLLNSGEGSCEHYGCRELAQETNEKPGGNVA